MEEIRQQLEEIRNLIDKKLNQKSVEKMVYTVEEAAEILNVNPKSIYQLTREDKIKHVRIGKSIRIPKQYIIDFIA